MGVAAHRHEDIQVNFSKPPSPSSVPATLSFNIVNESSTFALDKSGLVLFGGVARTSCKLVCATRCHANSHEWPRADLL